MSALAAILALVILRLQSGDSLNVRPIVEAKAESVMELLPTRIGHWILCPPRFRSGPHQEKSKASGADSCDLCDSAEIC